MSIGNRIKLTRINNKLTQEQVADSLNISYQAVSSWERDLSVPDVYNLIDLAKLFDVSVSYLIEEKPDFNTNKIFYDYNHMKTYIQTYDKNNKLSNTLKALPYAVKAHEGQCLKKSDIPYISHPLNMVCHLLAMNIDDDAIIAATLLHDVIEDCNKTIDDLPVDDEIKEIVLLLSHEKVNDSNRSKMLKEYYDNISKNPKASLIKLVDRCNNLTKMSWGLSRERMYRMIKETDIYILSLLDVIKNTEYDNAKWLLSYQINTTLDIYKRLL